MFFWLPAPVFAHRVIGNYKIIIIFNEYVCLFVENIHSLLLLEAPKTQNVVLSERFDRKSCLIS